MEPIDRPQARRHRRRLRTLGRSAQVVRLRLVADVLRSSGVRRRLRPVLRSQAAVSVRPLARLRAGIAPPAASSQHAAQRADGNRPRSAWRRSSAFLSLGCDRRGGLRQRAGSSSWVRAHGILMLALVANYLCSAVFHDLTLLPSQATAAVRVRRYHGESSPTSSSDGVSGTVDQWLPCGSACVQKACLAHRRLWACHARQPVRHAESRASRCSKRWRTSSRLVPRAARRIVPLHRDAERRPRRDVSAARRLASRLSRRVARAGRRHAARLGRPTARPTAAGTRRRQRSGAAAVSRRRKVRSAFSCSAPHLALPSWPRSRSRINGQASQSSARIRRRSALKTTPPKTPAFSPPSRRAAPDLLVVGLGAPKQEMWVHRHHRQLQAKVVICAGATIDFLAGHRRRSPVWMRRAVSNGCIACAPSRAAWPAATPATPGCCRSSCGINGGDLAHDGLSPRLMYRGYIRPHARQHFGGRCRRTSRIALARTATRRSPRPPSIISPPRACCSIGATRRRRIWPDIYRALWHSAFARQPRSLPRLFAESDYATTLVTDEPVAIHARRASDFDEIRPTRRPRPQAGESASATCTSIRLKQQSLAFSPRP